jgi:glycosyltransferase involved in cell wall biosynthesis
MKYVLIGPTYPYRGGIAHYTTLLYQHLSAVHDTQLYSFKRQYPAFLFPGKTDKDPSASPLQVPCEYLLDPLNPFTWVGTFRRIQRERPDAVILQWWVPYWAPALGSVAFLLRRFTPAKVLFICHNVLPHEGSIVDRFLTRLALAQGQYFIVQSQKDLDNLKALVPHAQTVRTVLPLYDGEQWEATDQAAAKNALGLAGPVVLFFGFVRKYKGLEYLIQAMPAVLRCIPAQLLIVGEFWKDRDAYLQMMQELGLQQQVTVVDRYVANEEIGLYFSAADVVVLPYVDATQSAVISLAYAFDKPVITTDVGGLPEVVKDGETGFVVPSRDAAALAAAMVKYFQEDCAPRFTANIRAQRDTLSWAGLVKLIDEFITAS